MLTGAIGALGGWCAARALRDIGEKKSLFGKTGMQGFDHAYLVYNADTGTIIDACQIEALLGAKKKLADLDAVKKCLAKDSVVQMEGFLARLKKGETVQPFLLKTGSHAFIECMPSRGKEENSAPLILLLLQDVTSRWRQQLMLQSENDAMKDEVRRYTSIMNMTQQLVWVRNRECHIQYCNFAYACAVEELHADANEIGVPELHKNMLRLGRRARETGVEQSERLHIVVGGKRRLFQVREMYIAEHEISIGFADDISTLEHAEEEIRNYLSAQENLLESSTSAVSIFGADMRLKFYNQAYVRMWSFEEAWLDTGPTFGEILEYLREKRRLQEQANFQAFKKQRMKLFTSLEPSEEFHFLPDGRTVRSVCIPHAMGGIILSYEDVTDRLALERSYNTLIAVQRETLDNLHEGVVVFGEDGRIRLTNPTYRTMWRLSEDDVAERTHIQEIVEKVRYLLGEDDWEGYKRKLNERIQSRALYSLRRERTDGVVLDWSMVPLPDGGWLMTYTDVTDSTVVERSLREKNDALQAADRLKTEFLANVSYELRSPLTSIRGFSEMLRQNYFGELNPQQREYVEGIHDSALHLSGLINDILDLAGIEAGYLTLEIQEFNIYEMLSEMLPLLSERIKHHHLHVKLDCAATIGKMHGDETRLKQVLFHLLSNAIKYSNEEGNIILGGRREKDSICLWVKDEGIGIPTDEQEAIFEKFYRGAAGSSKSGTGLGLSMVKNFIELHGGKVSLDSAVGTGTTVTCRLPYNPPQKREAVGGLREKATESQ